jgi:hypothetical protein
MIGKIRKYRHIRPLQSNEILGRKTTPLIIAMRVPQAVWRRQPEDWRPYQVIACALDSFCQPCGRVGKLPCSVCRIPDCAAL